MNVEGETPVWATAVVVCFVTIRVASGFSWASPAMATDVAEPTGQEFIQKSENTWIGFEIPLHHTGLQSKHRNATATGVHWESVSKRVRFATTFLIAKKRIHLTSFHATEKTWTICLSNHTLYI